MNSKAWQCRAIDMRLWATKVSDPYTQIEMMALADLYDRKASYGEMAAEDVSARLLDEAVHHGEAETRPLAHALGGEERLEGALQHFGGNARPGIRDAQQRVLAG